MKLAIGFIGTTDMATTIVELTWIKFVCWWRTFIVIL